jgi:hypothetical protein
MKYFLFVTLMLVGCRTWAATDFPRQAQPLDGNPGRLRITLTNGTQFELRHPTFGADTLYGDRRFEFQNTSVPVAIPTAQIKSVEVPRFSFVATTLLMFSVALVAAFFVLLEGLDD